MQSIIKLIATFLYIEPVYTFPLVLLCKLQLELRGHSLVVFYSSVAFYGVILFFTQQYSYLIFFHFVYGHTQSQFADSEEDSVIKKELIVN